MYQNSLYFDNQNSGYFDNLLLYFFLYRRSCNIVLFCIQAFRILQQRLTLLICNKQVLFVKDFSVRLSKHFGNHSLYFDNQNSFYFDNLLFYFFLQTVVQYRSVRYSGFQNTSATAYTVDLQ